MTGRDLEHSVIRARLLGRLDADSWPKSAERTMTPSDLIRAQLTGQLDRDSWIPTGTISETWIQITKSSSPFVRARSTSNSPTTRLSMTKSPTPKAAEPIVFVRANSQYWPLLLASMELLPFHFPALEDARKWIKEYNTRPKHHPLREVDRSNVVVR